MCRNIKALHNFKPPATDDEIRASALQFVRKLSGFAHPSQANEIAFHRAIDVDFGGTTPARLLAYLASLIETYPPFSFDTGPVEPSAPATSAAGLEPA